MTQPGQTGAQEEIVNETYDPSTHVKFRKRHVWLSLLGVLGVVVIGFLALGGRAWSTNNGIDYTLPQFHLVNPQVATTGPVETYATGPNGEPVVVQTIVHHPLEDAKALAQQALDKAKTTEESLKPQIEAAVGSAMKGVGDRLSKQIADLKQSMPQQTATPAPQSAVTTTLQSAAPTAPAQTSQVMPVQQAPQQQASLQDPVRAAQAIITPRNATPQQMKEMLNAYGQHGAPPNGAKITGFAEIPTSSTFTCPDGRPAELVRTGSDGHSRLWACHHDR